MSDDFQWFFDRLSKEHYPQEPEGSENRCPICGTHWDHHEFGVPHPYCPQKPLPGKSWLYEIPKDFYKDDPQ